ncbi:hypothetical protein GCM10009605_42330 [Nocardiopsis composta]
MITPIGFFAEQRISRTGDLAPTPSSRTALRSSAEAFSPRRVRKPATEEKGPRAPITPIPAPLEEIGVSARRRSLLEHG